MVIITGHCFTFTENSGPGHQIRTQSRASFIFSQEERSEELCFHRHAVTFPVISFPENWLNFALTCCLCRWSSLKLRRAQTEGQITSTGVSTGKGSTQSMVSTELMGNSTETQDSYFNFKPGAMRTAGVKHQHNETSALTFMIDSWLYSVYCYVFIFDGLMHSEVTEESGFQCLLFMAIKLRTLKGLWLTVASSQGLICAGSSRNRIRHLLVLACSCSGTYLGWSGTSRIEKNINV